MKAYLTSEDDRPRRGLGRRGKPMRIEQLPDEVLGRYEREVLARPRTTGRAAQRWLADQGYAVSISAVLRHRRRLAQVKALDARSGAFRDAVRTLAAGHGLTDADLSAGHAMRARHQLLARLTEAYREVSRTRRPAAPEEILAFARTVRMYVG